MEIKVKSANKRGYEIATENDSINLSFTESKTRRGRVGKGVAQTLDCACNQGVIVAGGGGVKMEIIQRPHGYNKGAINKIAPAITTSAYQENNYVIERQKCDCEQVGVLVGDKWEKMHDVCRRVYSPEGVAPACKTGMSGNTEPKIIEASGIYLNDSPDHHRGELKGLSRCLKAGKSDAGVIEPRIAAIRGRNPENPSDRTSGIPTEQRLEIGGNCANTLTSVQKDNVVVETTYRIRKLTPKECYRLMGFDDEDFEKAKWHSKEESEKILEQYPNHKGKREFSHEERVERMSDSQLYKQAGNSIVVAVLEAIFKNLL